MGINYKNSSRTSKTPRRPFEKERIDNEYSLYVSLLGFKLLVNTVWRTRERFGEFNLCWHVFVRLLVSCSLLRPRTLDVSLRVLHSWDVWSDSDCCPSRRGNWITFWDSPFTRSWRDVYKREYSVAHWPNPSIMLVYWSDRDTSGLISHYIFKKGWKEASQFTILFGYGGIRKEYWLCFYISPRRWQRW